MTKSLTAGVLAPDFELRDERANLIRLSSLRGSRVLLYFYAEDGTPACMEHACDLRDRHADLARLGLTVFGVSPDSVESHAAFKHAERLPVLLLSDPDHSVMERYGAWGKKKLYGRDVVGTVRCTFVIGPDGRIERVFQNIRVKGHVARVIAALA